METCNLGKEIMEPFNFCTALGIVSLEFEGVKDKGGVDYVKHLLHVAFKLKERGFNNSYQIAGLLHDLIEDFPLTWNRRRLELLGCSEEILDALDLLNHQKDQDWILLKTQALANQGMPEDLAKIRAKEEEYLRYVENLSKNDIARAVKIEDLLHNSDITRLNDADLEDPYTGRRLAKYSKALKMLTGGRVGYAH
jgi:(p)ppGpp synthase/HD superfamily hydrolase